MGETIGRKPWSFATGRFRPSRLVISFIDSWESKILVQCIGLDTQYHIRENADRSDDDRFNRAILKPQDLQHFLAGGWAPAAVHHGWSSGGRAINDTNQV